MKKYIVKLNGKEYEVEIEEVTREENDRAISSPSAHSAEDPVAASKAAISGTEAPVAAGGLDIKSPMPGAIVELNVQTGDQVREGDVLLVLEAMKMLNEIVAPRGGTVTRIGVNKGDMVGSGDLLLTIG